MEAMVERGDVGTKRCVSAVDKVLFKGEAVEVAAPSKLPVKAGGSKMSAAAATGTGARADARTGAEAAANREPPAGQVIKRPKAVLAAPAAASAQATRMTRSAGRMVAGTRHLAKPMM